MVKVGAVIVAAGMSTRMQQFKQLMTIGDLTIAERVVINFQRAGVREIVMVTGFQAELLEREVHRLGITFLRNVDYENTQMIDSAKIGLSFLMKQCDRILFCPVDVPLFTEETVRKLIEQKGKLVFPVYEQKVGHPILIHCSLIPRIIQYKGDGGLKGALDELGIEPVFLQVKDEGILVDADTRNDFNHLVDIHNSRLMRPQIRVRLAKRIPFFGPGTVTLLRQVENFGSVRDACEKMGISYSKGWTIIHTAEQELGYKIVERQKGGKNGGMSKVSQEGMKLIQLFETYNDIMQEIAEKKYNEIFLHGDCL